MSYPSLERRKLDLDMQRRLDDLDFKTRDLVLRSQAIDIQREAKFTSLTVALIAAFVGLGGAAAGAYLTGRNGLALEDTKHRQSMALERRKLQSTLISKATEAPVQSDVVKKLLFLIDMKLVTDEDDELVRRLNQAPQDVPFARASEELPKTAVIPSPSSRYDDAIAKYTAELKVRKDDPDLLNYLGYAQLKRGDLLSAVSSLERAVQVSKAGTWAKYNLALAYLAASRESDALRQVQELVAKAPEFKGIIRRDKQFFEYFQKVNGLSALVQ